jgi:hypothetical protein
VPINKCFDIYVCVSSSAKRVNGNLSDSRLFLQCKRFSDTMNCHYQEKLLREGILDFLQTGTLLNSGYIMIV